MSFLLQTNENLSLSVNDYLIKICHITNFKRQTIINVIIHYLLLLLQNGDSVP